MDAGLAAVLVALLTAPIASILTWVLNKRKTGADILNVISEAGQTAVETVTAALETVNAQLEEVRKENEQLHNDICELKEQNKQLIFENEVLRNDLQALKKQNEQLIEQINDMRLSYEQSQQRDS
jgi:uncharacterized coiled-coil DUF342 family protein